MKFRRLIKYPIVLAALIVSLAPIYWMITISFKREVDQRVGMLRLCHLNPQLKGYFHDDRFAEQFEIYDDLEGAMTATRS